MSYPPKPLPPQSREPRFVRELKQAYMDLRQYVIDGRLSGDSATTVVRNGMISSLYPPPVHVFRTRVSDTDELTIGADRSATQEDVVFLLDGADVKTVTWTAAETLTVSADGYIYYRMSKSAGTWSAASPASVASLGSLQYAADTIDVVVGYVEWSGSRISRWWQMLRSPPILFAGSAFGLPFIGRLKGGNIQITGGHVAMQNTSETDVSDYDAATAASTWYYVSIDTSTQTIGIATTIQTQAKASGRPAHYDDYDDPQEITIIIGETDADGLWTQAYGGGDIYIQDSLLRQRASYDAAKSQLLSNQSGTIEWEDAGNCS